MFKAFLTIIHESIKNFFKSFFFHILYLRSEKTKFVTPKWVALQAFFYKQLQAENWQKKAKAKQQPEAEFLPKMSKRTIVSTSIRLFD